MKRPHQLVHVPILGISLPRQDKDYLKAIHALPCVVTGMRCDEAHHPKGLAWGCGAGQKSPDRTAIPLAKHIHDEYHRIGVKSWAAKYGPHSELLARTWRSIEISAI